MAEDDVEIEFPLEILVHGTPVSLQAKLPAPREEWKERVRVGARAVLPPFHFASKERISVTLFYFPDGDMQGDLDNIIKPILDALRALVYIDDSQVDRVVAQRFYSGNVFTFSRPTSALIGALTGTRPVLYVRVSNRPFEELL